MYIWISNLCDKKDVWFIKQIPLKEMKYNETSAEVVFNICKDVKEIPNQMCYGCKMRHGCYCLKRFDEYAEPDQDAKLILKFEKEEFEKLFQKV